MAEYIEREVTCKGCIHYDICTFHITGNENKKCIHFKNKADVVEVVRCKDCRHFCPYEGDEHKGDCNELVGLESCVYEDDYCSYGEAKMDGKGEGE